MKNRIQKSHTDFLKIGRNICNGKKMRKNSSYQLFNEGHVKPPQKLIPSTDNIM